MTDTEILIGSCAPLAGPSKELGQSLLGGAIPYLKYANATLGGVNGRQLKLLSYSYDDGSDAARAIECFKRIEPVSAPLVIIDARTGADGQ